MKRFHDRKYLVPKRYQVDVMRDAVFINGVPHVGMVIGNYPYDCEPYNPWGGYSLFEEWEIGIYVPISPSGKVITLPSHILEAYYYWHPVGFYTKNGDLIPVDALAPLFGGERLYPLFTCCK